jgi:hypothetical protein
VFIEHPLENSMASFNFTSAVLHEGKPFIFGSWICIANGLGGLNSHRANSKEPEASSSTPSNDLDEFIDKLNDKSYPKNFKPVGIPKYDGKQDSCQWI